MWLTNGLGALRTITKYSAYLGAVCLLICVAVTVSDVVLRNFFTASILGSVEITQLMIMWAAFLTIPLGFAHRTHISVDVFVRAASYKTQRRIAAVNMLFAALVMAGYFYWGGAQALHAFINNEITLTVGIPVWFYWAPILFGTGLSVICALFVAADSFSEANQPPTGVRL